MSQKVYTLDEIKAILASILENEPVYKVVLFGSYVKEGANEKSDLDFVIDTKNTLKGFKFFGLIDKIEDKFNKPVDAFEKAQIIKNSKIDKEIQETGVVVYERK